MTSISYLLLSVAFLALVCSGKAWYYQSPNNQAANSHLLKNQFLLPPYPSYQHELLHQPQAPSFSVHDNRYYGAPGEFAEPTSYNELSFEGPYEVTSPRIPGLYFRLSSGVFVPVKAVYSFPPFLERIIQRIQGYYSVYNPPETLGLDRPLPGGGIPLQPSGDVLPVLPPQHPGIKPELGYIPPPPPPPVPGPVPPPSETPKPESEEPPTTEDFSVISSSSTTTESTKEETTPAGDSNELSSATEAIEATTDAPVEQTTTA